MFLVYYLLLFRTFIVASSLEFKFIYLEVSESLFVRFLRELGVYSRVSSAYWLVGAYLI